MAQQLSEFSARYCQETQEKGIFAYGLVPHLLCRLVEVDAGSDELVALLGAGDELLPPLGHVLGDVAYAFRVVVAGAHQPIRPVLHLWEFKEVR